MQQARAETGQVELRGQVVMVEDESGAATPQPQRGEQQEVGRAAGMDEVETARSREGDGEAPDAAERGEVLERVVDRPIVGRRGS